MKKRNRYLVVLSVFLFLSLSAFGCYYAYDANLKSKIKDGIAEELKDPDSIVISDLKYNSNGACGYYNAKNSYGGYVGKKFFYGEFTGGKFFKEIEDDMSIYVMTQCENLGLKVR